MLTYSNPRNKLIPCTKPKMSGCQATRYRIQSSSCPYSTCGFSQLRIKKWKKVKLRSRSKEMNALRILKQSLQVNLLLAVRTSLFLANDTPTAYAILMKYMLTRQPIARFDRVSLIDLHLYLITTYSAHVLLQVTRGHSFRFIVLQWNFIRILRTLEETEMNSRQYLRPFYRCIFQTSHVPTLQSTDRNRLVAQLDPSTFVVADRKPCLCRRTQTSWWRIL